MLALLTLNPVTRTAHSLHYFSKPEQRAQRAQSSSRLTATLAPDARLQSQSIPATVKQSPSSSSVWNKIKRFLFWCRSTAGFKALTPRHCSHVEPQAAQAAPAPHLSIAASVAGSTRHSCTYPVLYRCSSADRTKTAIVDVKTETMSKDASNPLRRPPLPPPSRASRYKVADRFVLASETHI